MPNRSTSSITAGQRLCPSSGTPQAVRADVDEWAVETLAGTERVDERGEGARLVPLDAEMAVEIEERGPSFVVRSTISNEVFFPPTTGGSSSMILAVERIWITGTSGVMSGARVTSRDRHRGAAAQADLDGRGSRRVVVAAGSLPVGTIYKQRSTGGAVPWVPFRQST
jgi:hypothetical protein